MKAGRRALLLTALLALAACRPGADTAQGVAERFLDEHYVRIDLKSAKQYTVGVARQKVDEEQRLVGDQRIDETTRRPHVSYKLAEEHKEGDDHVSFVYQGEVRVQDAGSFKVRWIISTKRESDGSWKVSNYQEFQ